MKKILIVLTIILIGVGSFLYNEISENAVVRTEKQGNMMRIKLASVNVYLLKVEEGYLLIDTAFAGSYDEFKKQLDLLKIKTSEIKFILITHHHDDHAGFAAELQKKSGARLIAHRLAVEPLAKGRSEHNVLPANICTKLVFEAFTFFKNKKHENFSYPPVKVTKRDFVIQSDSSAVTSVIGIKGKIIHTPGHTGDSISLILDDGSAFVGDLAMNIMGFCGLEHRPIYAEDMPEVFKSWEKLKTAGAKVIYTSHGETFGVEELAEGID